MGGHISDTYAVFSERMFMQCRVWIMVFQQSHQIRPLDIEQRIREKVGRVIDAKMTEIDRALKVSLGLD